MTRRRVCQPLLFAAVIVLVLAGCANAQTFTVLYDFGPSGSPMLPSYPGIIAQGRDGNLYSTSPSINVFDSSGAFFNITPSGSLTVPYEFLDGNMPESGVTLGTDGNFYATTIQSQIDSGELVQLTSTGGYTLLHQFSGGSDGGAPTPPPVEGTDGNYYGTTSAGGANGWGTFYKWTPSSGTLKTIYSLVDFAQGADPWAPLVQGTDGNFYSVTYEGGTSGGGVFYKITPEGKFTLLYDMPGGAGVTGPLVQGADGDFYGTNVGGTAFKITPTGKFTTLHNFLGSPDGSRPYGLVLATDGNFYGVTGEGGNSTNCQSGCGTIYRMTPSGTVTVLYNFDLTTGYLPEVTLTQHTNGILYGDTVLGGTSNTCTQGCGVFFSLDLGLKPFTRLVLPAGDVGKQAQFLGQGFTGTTAVSFNGVAASFSVVSDTFLTATVPSGAKTGSVKVTTPGGVLTSNRSFRVLPQIFSFTPPSGAVGTVVTITGAGLIQATKVAFGGVEATTFTVNSDSQITATVPTGAKTGTINVTTPGGTVASTAKFTVTS